MDRERNLIRTAAALALAPFLLGIWFVPAELSAYLRSYRGRPSARLGSTPGFVLAAGSLFPLLVGAIAWVQGRTGALFAPSAFLVPAALMLTMWSIVLRMALGLVTSSLAPGPLMPFLPMLREGFLRALRDAAQDIPGTCIAMARFVAGMLVSLGLGWAVLEVFADVSGWAYPAALGLSLGSMPLTWMPALHWLGARMDRLAEQPIAPSDVKRLGWLFFPATCAVFSIATLAAWSPLPMHVVREGRGVQAVRGMMRDRDQLRVANFVVDVTSPRSDDPGALPYVVHIRPSRGEAYDVASEYEPTYAGLRAHSCGTDCEEVIVQGPDWAMSIQLREDGTRRDDTVFHRIARRVGGLGVAALGTMALVLLVMFMRIAPVGRELRELTGAQFRHRLVGTLSAAQARVVDGVLTTQHGVITLLEGGVEISLPETQALLAADALLKDSTRCPVVVLMNTQPQFATHRTGSARLDPSAELILGEPARIEAQALERIATLVAPQVGLGVAVVLTLLIAMVF